MDSRVGEGDGKGFKGLRVKGTCGKGQVGASGVN